MDAREVPEPEAQVDREEGLPVSNLQLRDVRLEAGLITFRDARTGQVVVAKAINLNAALAELSAPLTLGGGLTVSRRRCFR